MDITPDDLSEELREIADIVGIDKTLQLCEAFSGISVYFPKVESVTREMRKRQIWEEYKNSRNPEICKILALKYGYSESHIRSIIREFRLAKQPKQLELF